jgi:hypothetical protein
MYTEGQSARGVKITTHLHVVPRLWMRPYLTPPWTFVACTGTTLSCLSGVHFAIYCRKMLSRASRQYTNLRPSMSRAWYTPLGRGISSTTPRNTQLPREQPHTLTRNKYAVLYNTYTASWDNAAPWRTLLRAEQLMHRGLTPRWENIFLSSPNCRDRFGATQTPIQWVKGAVSSTGVNGICHSHPSSIDIKK